MSTTDNSTALEDFNAVRDYLNANLFERDKEIKDTLAAVVSGAHIFMLGPPGVAKSQLVRLLSECFEGAEYFELLMTKFTKKIEVFGPMSIRQLKENDSLVYNTQGFLPTADFAFIDEGFKGNSAVLNSLLTAMQERLFHNGTTVEKLPLRTLFTASNETPADSSLEALYDRFLVRLEVEPIRSNKNFIALLQGCEKTEAPRLSLEVILQAEAEADKVVVPDSIYESFQKIRKQINIDQENFGDVYVSDRRWKPIVKFVKAHCWLSGKSEVSSSDIPLIRNCLWSEPDQIDRIDGLLHEYLNATYKRAMSLGAEVKELDNDIKNLSTDKRRRSEELHHILIRVKQNKEVLQDLMDQTKDKEIERLCQRILADIEPIEDMALEFYVGRR